MNILIIDDDLCFSKIIKKDILSFFSDFYDDISIEVINTDFKKVVEYSTIDLIFLDIDLKTKYNGINIGQYIQSNFPKAIIVFVSSHEELVFSALSVRFFQFVRKSKYQTDIIKVLKQIKKHIDENIKKTVIRVNGRSHVIKISEIIYLMSIGHDLIIKTINNEFTIYSSLVKFMNEVDYKELVQIQRNMVINLNFTKDVTRIKVIMFDDVEHNVGRKYQNNLIEKYEEYLLK
ncbi:LytR/AlgR family response regulator transcription factor [Candidatus Stoquefichus sp. SB1]|uniref:LytR/AlgR family response regulator transcription factor n=1 Tax=Candidatus Stoquefichus sp. SB1 TaxID=1658109 RepID=UPI00067E83BF|nr:LytTR family transcriptional regulator DNA-binding domain-containing protein [Candidatus Stoquefichus sp. SB1]